MLDVQMVESTNQGINQFNERALPVLQGITGMSLGLEPEKWRAWWSNQLGYAYRSDVPEILRIEIAGKVGSGNITVRPPRRNFWAWLTRQPLPYAQAR